MTVSRTICLGFLATILVGSLLLMMPFASAQGTWTNPLIALFTATSAVCVTGLSVVDVGMFFSFWGQLTLLILVQIGGLGYMIANTFLLLIIGARFTLRDKIAIQQALDRTGMQGSREVLLSIIATTAIFEISGMLLLLPAFLADRQPLSAIWLAIFHSVNSWNNAGFSLFSDSLIGYQSSILVNLTITGLIIFGGLGYQVILELYLWLSNWLSRRERKFVFSFNFKVGVSTTLFLFVFGTIAFFAIELRNPDTLGGENFTTQLLIAWFQSVSARTAGFNTIEHGKLTTAALFITIALMFIGASPGGTGGGIKTTTLRILVSATRSVLRGKDEVILYQRRVPLSMILKAIGVLVGSFATVITATIIIAITDSEVTFIQVFFEVVSAFATVGLSTGITASISSAAKLTLIVTMYIGRVGILLLMSALLGDPIRSRVRYPEENLLVG
ncbi:TrkH family potassium uptake protein [Chamaesiphon sp.]|uniref:TrkH family potassium uptake protein n=1 Tax=Chamaesiphon sp. TaxID=2814140 RepID=UPI0035946FCD